MATVVASSTSLPTPEPPCFTTLSKDVKNGDFERGWTQGASSTDYWGYTQSSGNAWSYRYTSTYEENGRPLPGSNKTSAGFRARTMDPTEGPYGAEDTTIYLSQQDIYIPAGTKVEARAWIYRFISAKQIETNAGIFTAVLKFDGVLVGAYDFVNTYTNTWYQIGTGIGTGTGPKKIAGLPKQIVKGDCRTVTVEVRNKSGNDTLGFAVDDFSVTAEKKDFPMSLLLC
ncbi:hypothetical protein NX059_005631 [Plenodomus lindquistii]|nr:hypothetical protein NX059_005631 [Plenodomus lindquistii]